MEKKKFEKVKETLGKTEEELKDLKKVNMFCFFLRIQFKNLCYSYFIPPKVQASDTSIAAKY